MSTPRDVISSAMGQFAPVPHALIDDPELGDREIGCYAALMKHAAAGEWRAFPGIARLSRILKCGRDRVLRSVTNLEHAGWLQVQRTTGQGNRYFLMAAKADQSTQPTGPVDSADGYQSAQPTLTRANVSRANEPTAPNGAAPRFPSREFTERWQIHAGKDYKLTPADYSLAKQDVHAHGLEQLATAMQSYWEGDHWYTRDGHSYRGFHTHLGELLNNKPRLVRTVSRCPSCGSVARSWTGSQWHCLNCGREYE